MNKTVSANISGFIFNIEEDAYQRLLSYLDKIKSSFSSSDSGDEIMQDIEARIAELFQERLKDNKQVITMTDVDEVVQIMGQPEDYTSDFAEDEDERKESNQESQSSRMSSGNRRIYRDPDDAVIGGVCAGFSHYFGWDPIILRLLLVLLVIFGGTGILLYIILWIVVPEAKSTAEKLQMRGEKVTVENISKKVEEEMENVKTNLKKFTDDTGDSAKKAGQSAKSGISNFFNGIGNALGAVGTVIAKIIGLAFLVAGLGLIIGMVSSWFAADAFLFGFDHVNWSTIDDLIFAGSGSLTLIIVGTSLVFFSIAGMLILTGIKILLDIKASTKALTLSLVGFLILGIVLSSITGVRTVRDHVHEAETSSELVLDSLGTDTLYINVLQDDYFNDDLNRNQAEFFELMTIEDGKVILGEPVRLRFYERDSTSNFKVEVELSADGPYHSKALEYAENIEYDWNFEGNTLNFDPNLSFPYSDRYHSQEVIITVFVPVGKYVQLGNNAGRIYWRSSYEGELLRMQEDGWEVIED